MSPIIANLYMKEFQAKAIRTAPNPPAVWLRYVDDTFVNIHEYFVNEFTEHLNSIDENIHLNSIDENIHLNSIDENIHLNSIDENIKFTTEP